MLNWIKSKTWKRETALALLLFVGVLAYEEKTEELEVLAWPVFLFAGAAFGMAWATKQAPFKNTENFRNLEE